MCKKYIYSKFSLVVVVLFSFVCSSGQEKEFTKNLPYQMCWEIAEKTEIKIASDNDQHFFISNSSGNIKAIDLEGNKIWQANIGGEITANPLFNSNSLYVLSKPGELPADGALKLSGNEYTVSSIDATSGITNWTNTFLSVKKPSITLRQDRLLVVTTIGKIELNTLKSHFIVLDVVSGDKVFEKYEDFEVKQILPGKKLKEDVIIALQNSLASFSTLNGDLKIYETLEKNIYAGVITDNGVLLSDDKGNVYFVKPHGEVRKLKLRFGAKVSDFTFYKDRLIVSSLDNFVYSISSDGKKVTWKRRFAGRIVERLIINENFIVVSSLGDNSLYFLNHDDGRILNRINLAAGEEVTALPVLLNNFVIIPTNLSIKAFTAGNCKI